MLLFGNEKIGAQNLLVGLQITILLVALSTIFFLVCPGNERSFSVRVMHFLQRVSLLSLNPHIGIGVSASAVKSRIFSTPIVLFLIVFSFLGYCLWFASAFSFVFFYQRFFFFFCFFMWSFKILCCLFVVNFSAFSDYFTWSYKKIILSFFNVTFISFVFGRRSFVCFVTGRARSAEGSSFINSGQI